MVHVIFCNSASMLEAFLFVHPPDSLTIGMSFHGFPAEGSLGQLKALALFSLACFVGQQLHHGARSGNPGMGQGMMGMSHMMGSNSMGGQVFALENAAFRCVARHRMFSQWHKVQATWQ